MTDFTGSDSWHTTITGPDEADPVTAASLIDPLTLMADRDIWLKNRLVGCGQITNMGSASSSTLLGSPLIDLKEETSWTLIPGMTLTVPSAAEVDDIFIVQASVHVFYQGDDVGTDYIKLGLVTPASPVLANSSVQIISDQTPTPRISPVSLHHTGVVTLAGGTAVALYGACATADGNTYAQVLRPFRLSYIQLRPVAEP